MAKPQSQYLMPDKGVKKSFPATPGQPPTSMERLYQVRPENEQGKNDVPLNANNFKEMPRVQMDAAQSIDGQPISNYYGDGVSPRNGIVDVTAPSGRWQGYGGTLGQNMQYNDNPMMALEPNEYDGAEVGFNSTDANNFNKTQSYQVSAMGMIGAGPTPDQTMQMESMDPGAMTLTGRQFAGAGSAEDQNQQAPQMPAQGMQLGGPNNSGRNA